MPKRAPDRYRSAVIPHIMVSNATDALEYYARALGAEELFRITAPSGQIIHSEIMIDGNVVMVGDASPPFAPASPSTGSSVGLHVYVDDVDAVFSTAILNGAKAIHGPEDMFYGDRMAMLQDPFGHVWVLLSHQEDLEPAEIKRRGEALLAKN